MADKPPLLYLAHRIPYPPNKGDKIRSFHILKYLADHFRIYLGTFVDDADDWQYCPVVRSFCAEAFFVERKPRWHKLLASRALLTGDALSVKFYASPSMQAWVDHVTYSHAIDRALIFCSPMAQFVLPHSQAGQLLKTVVVDFVDVDSEKWQQYSDDCDSVLARSLYRREANTLGAFERMASKLALQSFFVSDAEASLFRSRALECDAHIGFFSNGVDTVYFRPDESLENHYAQNSAPLVFTGAMDYLPNVEAVTWFAEEVFPKARKAFPDLEFWIVGSRPAPAVRKLALLPSVFVTGRVDDVRPYLQYALAAVAPLRIARGVQNKVLEALAMGKPVLATSEAAEGVPVFSNIYTFSDVDTFTLQLQALRISALHSAERGFMGERSLSWADSLQPLARALT